MSEVVAMESTLKRWAESGLSLRAFLADHLRLCLHLIRSHAPQAATGHQRASLPRGSGPA